MIKEFKEFISKGNLVEIAVGLILALAFAGLVGSFTENLINPIIGAIFGQPNLDSLVIDIGEAQLRYGAFLTTLLNFVIVAFVLFLIIIAMTLIQRWVLGERDERGMGKKQRKGADRQPGLLAEGAARLEAGPQGTTGGGLT